MKRIEELLEKYYAGETSIEEERMLRRFFAGPDVPEHLSAESALFRYFEREGRSALPGNLQERLEGMIEPRELVKPSRVIGLKHYWIGAAAAVILILVGIFVDMQIRKNTSLVVRKDTYEDPYMAYAEAKRVLYLVSEKLNEGTEPLKNLEKIEEPVKYMQPVFSFGNGIQHLEQFSRIEKTRKLLSN